MTISLPKVAVAAGLLGFTLLPLPAYAIEDDVEVDTPGASVEIDRDRPGILPRLRGDDPDVYVETPDPDVDVEDDDIPPSATVEVDPD